MLDIDPATLGQGNYGIASVFKNDVSGVYAAYREDGEVFVIAIDRHTGYRSVVPIQGPDSAYLHPSMDGKYLAVFYFFAPQRGFDLYSLPDLRHIASRPWPRPRNFWAFAWSWSPSGHRLAYLEQSADGSGLLTLFDPDALQSSSAIIVPDIATYAAHGDTYLRWSPDGEVISIHNDARLDIYVVKSGTAQNVVDGVDFHYEPGVGMPSILWIGDTHRLTYAPHDAQDGVTLWVYNPDNTEKKLLARHADNGIFYSPDNTYALLDVPTTNGRFSTVMFNLLTQQSVLVRGDAGIVKSGSLYWLDDAQRIILGYPDEILWMRLDGTDKHVMKLAWGWYDPVPPSHRWLAYVSPPDGTAEIGVIDLDTEGRRRLGTLANGFGHTFPSPDGRILAFTNYAEGTLLSLFASDGSWSHRFHTDSGNYSRLLWSPDSTEVALMTYIYGKKNTVHILAANGEQVKQFDLPPRDLMFSTWNNCEAP
jgi:hypothetical protein